MANPTPLWIPTQERVMSSNLQAFIKHVNMQGEAIENYQQLHQWSISNSEEFWREVWNFCDLIGYQGDCTSGDGLARWGHFIPARDRVWFPQAKLNYAENLLSDNFERASDTAILFRNERGEASQLTWKELSDQVSVIQQWLKSTGVGAGDVVAGYLPHLPQTLIAMLATTSLGAIWTSTSPDFGSNSVVERFGQVNPKVLFCCNGYTFSGKSYPMQERNRKVVEAIPSLKNVCQINYIETESSELPAGAAGWDGLLKSISPQPVQYERVGFNDPLFILYSSGTTGKSKCIIHSTGGILINHLKEHQLHCDIQPGDRVFYYTTCGWMMWNWQVSALASGATLVIYDGSPVYPTEEILWKLTDELGITLFGTSAKFLEAQQKSQIRPRDIASLSSLRTLCSTGSVLYPEQFDYVYQAIKEDLHLASISGGTDICGCFVLGNPVSPVYRGECQGAGLGLDIAVYNEEGQAILAQRGELVCRNSFPNQPIGFWHDQGEKYHQAYWDKFYGVWHHGDEVAMSHLGGVRFYGRSDATLNPGGVRIGTAEIYQQVNHLPEIVDSIAVGQRVEGNEQIVLFVQLADGVELNDDLKKKIGTELRQHCSPRHVPAAIYTVSEIPRTRSGKLVELAVRQTIHGEEVKNIGAIANPGVLHEIAMLIRDQQ